MSPRKKLGQLTEHISSAKRDAIDRTTNPLQVKVCPVCGKTASSKFFNEKLGKYEYRHKQLYKESILHHAEK